MMTMIIIIIIININKMILSLCEYLLFVSALC